MTRWGQPKLLSSSTHLVRAEGEAHNRAAEADLGRVMERSIECSDSAVASAHHKALWPCQQAQSSLPHGPCSVAADNKGGGRGARECDDEAHGLRGVKAPCVRLAFRRRRQPFAVFHYKTHSIQRSLSLSISLYLSIYIFSSLRACLCLPSHSCKQFIRQPCPCSLPSSYSHTGWHSS